MVRFTAFFLSIAFGVVAALAEDFVETRLKAEAGDAIAQDRIAESYLSSFYFADALKWFEAAASKGVTNAQWRLGLMLLEGKPAFPQRSAEVRANPKQGIFWLRKAALSGHTDAQRDLGRCFESGKGVSRDLVEAYKWFGIAAKSDSIVAKTFRDQLALKMTPQQLQEGERRVAAFSVGETADDVWQHLELKGISGPPQKRLAIINTTTVGAGESFVLELVGEKASFKCEKITDRSVIVSNSKGVREIALRDR